MLKIPGLSGKVGEVRRARIRGKLRLTFELVAEVEEDDGRLVERILCENIERSVVEETAATMGIAIEQPLRTGLDDGPPNSIVRHR